MPRMFKRLVLPSLLALAACGDNGEPAAPDAGTVVTPGFTPGPHANPPQVHSFGGDVLSSPKIQPIFFANDDSMQGQVEQFLTMLAGSSYWSTTTQEYGVGTLTVLPTIVEHDVAAPTTDRALQQYLKTHLAAASAQPGWTYDRQTIYSVFLPDGVVLDAGFGKSCQAFGAYHDEAIGTSGESIVYALMPRCAGIDDLTSATSHEFIEAATDPYVNTAGAFSNVDAAHAIWGVIPGGEVGDMCEYVEAAYSRVVGSFMVQRTWSNASAAAGHDPCVPVPMGTPYVAATPHLEKATYMNSPFGGSVWTHGTTLPMGATQTIDVELFTDAPSSQPFHVDVVDSAAFFGEKTPEIQLSWDRQDGNNGDKLHLTATRVNNGPDMLGGTILSFTISYDSTIVSQWWSFVSN
jgi:hypothetical protein